jgi:hypothetical protein
LRAISEEIEPHSTLKYFILLITCCFIFLPIASASSNSAYNVEKTEDYVKATAKCSCGLNDYAYHTKSFKNYCPHCNSTSTLIFNPKGVSEGEWTCYKCSSDYCAADGKEKIIGSPYCLTAYTPPDNQVQNHTKNEKIKIGMINQIGKYRDKSFLG